MKKGIVYLVGAGPGDPGLMTLKGAECLSRSDVVIYDHLLDDSILNSLSEDVEKIYVGKQASDHTLEQIEINNLLIDRAMCGKTVVRLKGGDPFVFGRGGEEAEALAQNGIIFEVVPGISSAIAVPAYAGIPVTHRGVASSFAVVTGHEDPGKKSSCINWEKLATGVDTLIILMGMQNLSEIVAKLDHYGKPLNTPVAVINNGTRIEQRMVAGTLADIEAQVKQSGIIAPAVVVVGKVVDMRQKLRWFDNRVLSGKRIMVVRARHQASYLSKLLIERGAIPIEIPVIDIQSPLDFTEFDRAIAKLNEYDWVLFTSTNGVESFFSRLRRWKKDARAFSGLKVAALGSATAEALRNAGISADFIPSSYSSDGIIKDIKELEIVGQRFLLARADIAGKELVSALNDLGAKVDDIAVYRTLIVDSMRKQLHESLESRIIDIIAFTSSSTVTNLLHLISDHKELLSGVKIACIGPKTKETAIDAGLTVDIMADEYTIPGLVSSIEDYYRKEG